MKRKKACGVHWIGGPSLYIWPCWRSVGSAFAEPATILTWRGTFFIRFPFGDADYLDRHFVGIGLYSFDARREVVRYLCIRHLCPVACLAVCHTFLARDIKGSHSWIKIGPFSLQSAEFAKCATALALAKFMSAYGYNISRWKDFLVTLAIIVVPIVLIILQRETGSALVYLAFFLMLYREGMPGAVLFTGVSAVAYFVVGVRFEHVMLGHIPTSAGEFLVLMMVILFTIGMVHVYCDKVSVERNILFYGVGVIALALGFSGFVIPFDITWILITVCVAMILYLCYVALSERVTRYFYIALFALGSMAFFYSADYVLNSVMEPHQRVRINVLLGLEDDPSGAGYNVNQAKIAMDPEGYEEKAS